MNGNWADAENSRGESKLLVGGEPMLNQYEDDIVCGQAR